MTRETTGIRLSGFVLLLAAGCLLFAPAGKAPAATALPGKKPAVSAGGVTVPVPAARPDTRPDEGRRPDALALLSFGRPPVPGRKPLSHNKRQEEAGPLSAANASLYRRIFTAQSAAEWSKADGLIAKLTDSRLMGHVLQQRYTHPASARTTYGALSDWLDRYADLPGADRIYRLASARAPRGVTPPRPEKAGSAPGLLEVLVDGGKAYVSPRKLTGAQKDEAARLTAAVGADLSRRDPGKAYDRLRKSPAAKSMDPASYDILLARVAGSYMLAGNVDKALGLARAAAKRSGVKAPQAGWIGGLCAWRGGDYKSAALLFTNAAASPYSSDWMASAGAYWASRALSRAGADGEARAWLERAAERPRTFYGLIATRALDRDFDFNWAMPAYGKAQEKMIAKIPAARRAQALVAAGQFHLAEAELRRIKTGGNEALREALLAYAGHVGLPSYAMQVAQAVAHPGGGLYDAALYPLSPWEPQEGYKIDRALIHALIRQESRFDPAARSRSGATGLMQLMPATASYVAGDHGYKSKEGRHSLTDPQVNIDLGQRYVENLLQSGPVDDDLFALAAAYNAGPGNLAEWKKKYADTAADPLLFIESIPLGETRDFIEKVMANYWIYRLRLDQPAPSLDAVAEGRAPRYVSMDAGLAEKQAALASPSGAFRVADGGLD